MSLLRLLCAPVVLAVAVVEDAVTLVPRRAMLDYGPSATERAVKSLAENK
jgi:hypothetical protein